MQPVLSSYRKLLRVIRTSRVSKFESIFDTVLGFKSDAEMITKAIENVRSRYKVKKRWWDL